MTNSRGDPLSKEILGRMLDMVIREGRHGVVTMVVIRLVADADALDASLPGSLFKVLGQKLALLVEVVAGTLRLSVLQTTPVNKTDLQEDRENGPRQ